MVVGVEPFLHLSGWEIDVVLLVTTSHGEEGVEWVETRLGVGRWDDVESVGSV